MSNSALPAKRRFVTRFLRIGDIPALLDLEHKQWTAQQAARADDFRARLDAHPELCVGAFCRRTGELLASLFCKPTSDAEWTEPGDWAQSADLSAQPEPGSLQRARSLFGISLTSIDPGAALQLVAFQYLYALKRGYRAVFLGSPIPGLKRHLDRHPGASVESYVRATRSGLPLDPQLRYYHGKGFRKIVAVRPGYFPHEGSCDYGVILKARVPFTPLAPLVRCVPLPFLRTMASWAPRLALPEGVAAGPERSSLGVA